MVTRREDLTHQGYVAHRIHRVYADAATTIEPCRVCAGPVEAVEMWELARPPIGFTDVVALLPDVHMCAEVQPCGHDVAPNADGTSYWVHQELNKGVVVTWQRREIP